MTISKLIVTSLLVTASLGGLEAAALAQNQPSMGGPEGAAAVRGPHLRRPFGRQLVQARSSNIAVPWPTPTHMNTSAYRPPDWWSCATAVITRRAPDMPSG